MIAALIQGDYVAWTQPQFSRRDVDKAGAWVVANLASAPDELAIGEWEEQWSHAWTVINNWRSAHSYPLQVPKMNLKTRAQRIYPPALVAQRLKRFSSIYVKLRRNPNMQLSQMQDIGGCRAVMPHARDVQRLVEVFEAGEMKNPHGRHLLVKKYDYIEMPKNDGYRSVHFVYKYRTRSFHRSVFNDQRIEIQIRSRLQHAWATAVETVDIATSQALKSNVGEARWKRFFSLLGSAIALRERRPLVPGTPTKKEELAEEIRDLAATLNVQTILTGISTALNTSTSGESTARAFLLVLDAAEKQVTVKGYSLPGLPLAQEEYANAEKQIRGKAGAQAVLVSVDSLDNLYAAFPNFFLDTDAFIDVLRSTIGEPPLRRHR